MNKRIKWINTAPGQPEERGNWMSSEERFSISPNYRSTVYPDGYTVTDCVKGTEYRYRDTVRECKEWAENQLIDPKIF